PMRYRLAIDGEISQERTEPIAADARANKDGRENAKLKLLAGLLGVNYDDLKQREHVRRRRRMRFIVMSALLLIGIFAALGVALFSNRHEALRQRMGADRAREDARETASQSVFLQAVRSIDNDRDSDALSLLARSLSLNPRNEAARCRLVTLLNARTFPLRRVKLNLKTNAVSAQFSPDGRRILTTSSDQSAVIWDSETTEPTMMINGDSTGRAKFSTTGDTFLTVNGSAVRVWDARSGKLIVGPLEHGTAVFSAEFSPDGKRIATGCFDNKAWVWDTLSGRRVFDPLLHGGRVNHAIFSPDGKCLITISDVSTIHFWDAVDGKELAEPITRANLILSAQFSSDGKRLLTGSDDHSARIWDINTQKPLIELVGHEDSVEPARFDPSQSRIVTASRDKTARIWDSKTGRALVPPLRHGEWVSDARFDGNGNRVATASWDRTARVWNTKTGRAITEPLTHGGSVHAVQFSPNGEKLLTASAEDKVRLWDVRDRRILPVLLNHEQAVKFARFSSDGRRVATGSSDGTARIWDAVTGKPLTEPMRHDREFQVVQFSPDDHYIVTAYLDTARIWDSGTGEAVAQPIKHNEPILSAHFSPDGKRLLTASVDSTARIWNAETAEAIGVPMKHASLVYSAEFSPDGQRVVTASLDKTARVWDAHTGRPITEPLTHTKEVNFADFSADGRRVITASGDGTARIWDVHTGKALNLFGDGGAKKAQFSRSGALVATAGGYSARVWDARNGDPVTEPLGHENSVESLQFSPNGKWLATASLDGKTRIWDVRSGKLLAEFFAHEGTAGVRTVQFSPAGNRVLSACDDGTARIWDFAPGKEDAPDWLPRLAEALAGKRINDQNIFEPIAEDETIRILDEIRKLLAGAPAESDWAAWGRWFLDDPTSRMVSPFSQMTRPDYLETLITRASKDSLNELELLSIGNPIASKRIAEARSRIEATPAPVLRTPTRPLNKLESQLVGRWQGPRHLVEYFPDHTFGQNGLSLPGMKWRLEGRSLTKVYPDLGDDIPAWYPLPGAELENIIEVTTSRLVTESTDAGNASRNFHYRVDNNSKEEGEEAAGKAKLDALRWKAR
ncbi:MAG: hypothetical protein H0U23_03290, partial [Blastocatellia bacterium]|nr:hypothetical protein [Blastocatellia bacterium]